VAPRFPFLASRAVMLRRSFRPRHPSARSLAFGLGLAIGCSHGATTAATPDALDQKVAAARQAENPPALRTALEQLGRARYATGAFPAAFAALDEATKFPTAPGAVPPAAQADLLLHRADAARQGAAPDVAEAALRDAIAAYDPLGAEGAKGRVNARNLLASLFIYRLHARFDEAERLLQEALAIAESAIGPESSHAASVLSNLGKVLELRGENDAAEQTMRRALVVMERTAGPEARTTMISLRTLAYHYLQRGLPYLAEPLNVRIYETERRLRPQHPATAAAAGELGWLFHTLGDTARGEPLLREALALREKTLGPDALDTAVSLAHLGVLLDSTGRHAEAVPMLRRCLEIRRRVLPEQSEAVAGAMSILGDALGETGASDEALPLLRRARELRTALHGPDDLAVARSSNALARTLGQRGELAAARREAAEAWRIVGPTPAVPAADRAEIAGMVAALAIAAGDEAAARAAVAIAQQEHERLLAGTLGFTSEAQRLALLRGYAPLDLPASAGDAPAIARAVLRTKGLVLDSLLEDEQLARHQTDPATAALLERLRRARTAALTHSTAALFQEAETLEKQLATRVQAVGGRRRALATAASDVQAALPVGAALIEFVRYEQVGPRLHRTPTYGALVIAPGIPPRWRKLGDEASIRREVERLKLLAQSGGPVSWLEDAHATLLAPVLAALPPGTRQLYLAPDALLHAVPWAVLRDRDQGFLAERYTIAGVGAGRDLLPRPADDRPPSPRELVVFAAPAFGRREGAAPTIAATGPLLAAAARWRGVSLHDLPGAQREGEEIGRLARDRGLETRVYSGAAASESCLRGVRAPRILHLATHGFVLPVAPGATAMDAAGLALAGGRDTLQAWQRGANPAAADDGILTAREAAALDLHGTDLVVLSACDTAAGEAIGGEGVFGLRRGFARAGARNLLLTLWPVADDETTAFMRGFYARLLDGAAPEEALAAVQLETLRTIASTRGPVAAARVAGAFVIDVRR
jgi:CHAT domain-containing protein/tetratricopeptide (TPR) repeat protein